MGVCCAPDGDVADEMGVCVCEVEGSECVCWKEFFCVFEAVDEWSEFLDDVDDCLIVFEVVQFWVAGVEDGIVGFGCVWDEIIGEEVVDEVAEF